MKLASITYLITFLSTIQLSSSTKTETVTKIQPTTPQWRNDAQYMWEQYGRPGSQQVFNAQTLNKTLPWLDVYFNSSSLPKMGVDTLKDWLFVSWSKDTLQSFLKDHSIPFKASQTKDELLSVINSNMDKLAKELKNMSNKKSLGDSKFLNKWSVKDLNSWLQQNKIEVDKSIVSNKDKLMQLVTDNMYSISIQKEKAKYEMFYLMNLANKKLFDNTKKGAITANSFKDFSKEELAECLKFHGYEVSKKMEKNRNQLLKQAQTHLDLLTDDVNWYIEKSKEMTSPYIGKNPEFIESLFSGASEYASKGYEGASEFAAQGKEHAASKLSPNHVMSVIDNWSEEFMTKVFGYTKPKSTLGSAKEEIKQKIMKHTPDMLKPEDVKHPYLYWPINTVKNWFHDTKQQVGDSDLYDQKNQKMKDLNEHMDQLFQSWTIEDLKEYMNSMNIPFTESPEKESLMVKAKDYTRKMLGYEPESTYQKYSRKAREISRNLYDLILLRQ
ncbi:hypothetical protein C6P45_001038 [Maudiozyma exigua]|uniref:Meiotic sister chromatid recombination protein 1 n=1 Tax=Maudiozyma exigua TaxID=34358 RepID=A0A9P7B6K1_MAUEX|nr:hypothetical protein C6P45_001038 [Kazachstania exigua]